MVGELSEISIIQFNCGQANYRISKLIFDAIMLVVCMLLVVQELAFSKLTSSMYCPRGFKLVYEANLIIRVCFMVSDQLETDQ